MGQILPLKLSRLGLGTFLFALGCGQLGGTGVPGDFADSQTLIYEEARLNELRAAQPKNDNAPLGLGWVKAQKGNYPECVTFFNEALKLEYFNPRAYMGLGYCYEKMDKNDYAIKSYQEALKLKPDWYFAHFELGKIYHKLGEKKAYFLELDTLVANHPRLANTLLEIIYHQGS